MIAIPTASAPVYLLLIKVPSKTLGTMLTITSFHPLNTWLEPRLSMLIHLTIPEQSGALAKRDLIPIGDGEQSFDLTTYTLIHPGHQPPIEE